MTTFQLWNDPLSCISVPKQQMSDKNASYQWNYYLVVLDFLGNFHGDREQFVKTTDEWISYRVEDKFMAQGVHPRLKILHMFTQQQVTAEAEKRETVFTYDTALNELSM